LKASLGLVVFGVLLLLFGVAIPPVQPLSTYSFWIGILLAIIGIAVIVKGN